jgi:hypothetical protein
VVAAHEGFNLDRRELLDRTDELVAQRLLVALAHPDYRIALAAVGEPSLPGGQRILHHDDDEVMAEEGLGLPRASAAFWARTTAFAIC